MKRILKMAVLVSVLTLGSSLRNDSSAQYYPNNDISYQTFYDELSPYGEWIDYPGYGFAWVPDAGSDFRPYSSNGHWVWTEDYEWMWVSDYDWGWAPFHYGRWLEDDYYGWIWVPGYEWSPGWVVWRDGGDYYGWAPLRPGINISINFNIGSYNPPYDYWCFVPRRYISSPRIYDYCLDRRQNVTIINYTTIINYNNYRSGFGFRSGPRLYDAERYCGRINPVRFRESYTPGRTFYRNNEVSVYRPNIRRDEDRNIAPRRFERYDRNSDFRNNNNDFRRPDNAINNGRPDRRDRMDNEQPFRRNDDNIRQRQNNDVNNRFPDQRRMDRNNNNLPGENPADRRIFRPTDPSNRNPNNDANNPDRRFDRRNDDNNNGNDPFRRPEMKRGENRPTDQPVQPGGPRRQEQPPVFDRRRDENNNGNDGFRRPEMKRNENRPTEQPVQQPEFRRQESPRQFERRQEKDNDNGGGNGNGKGRGRSRFE